MRDNRNHPELPLAYKDFVSQKPVFLWKDPFGRWVRFTSRYFLPPVLCE
jgi:hypothetical protein